MKKWDLPDGYEFQDENGNVINTQKIVLKKKQPQYPKTVEECAELLNYNLLANKVRGYDWGSLAKLQQLFVCRDAYWKLAGNWEFSFEFDCYYLCNEYGSIQKFKGTCDSNAILTFPTEEMRDAFYENFKELIEEVKELL